jgi:hypothetical protein
MDIYRERAHLVAFLTRLFPAFRWTDEREPHYPVIAVETQAGQMSWHVHPDDMELFAHVTEEGHWDGHTTEEKYERLKAVGDDFAVMLSAVLSSIEKITTRRDIEGA